MNFLIKPFPTKRTRGADDFWAWFLANSNRYRDITTQDTGSIKELAFRLGQVADGLTFEIGKGAEMELAISADGIKDRFPDVTRLVASAPNIPGWRIVPFRQRKPLDGASVASGSVQLDPDDIWFSASICGAQIDVIFYVRNLNEANSQDVIGGCFILIDAALGEYDVEACLGNLAWNPLPIDPISSGLKMFRDLPVFVDRFKSGLIE